MNKNLRSLWLASAGAIATLGVSSCAYDAYEYSASSGRSYGSGYGSGSPNTSLFIRTGDSRWGYDPNRRSYYDYNRGSYYDPYRNGYYPRGYCPEANYRSPHPYGWDAGRGYCPPPRRVSNVVITEYRDYGYGRQDRGYSQPGRSGGFFGGGPERGDYGRPQENHHDFRREAPQQPQQPSFNRGNQPSAPSNPPATGRGGSWFGGRRQNAPVSADIESAIKMRGRAFEQQQSANLGSQPEPVTRREEPQPQAPPEPQRQAPEPQMSAPEAPPSAPEPPPSAPEPQAAPEPPAAAPEAAAE